MTFKIKRKLSFRECDECGKRATLKHLRKFGVVLWCLDILNDMEVCKECHDELEAEALKTGDQWPLYSVVMRRMVNGGKKMFKKEAIEYFLKKKVD